MTTTSIAAGTVLFALGAGVACALAAATGRGLSRDLGLALGALELAILTLVLTHAVDLAGDDRPLEAKPVAYLVAGALLLPALVLGTGATGRSRALAAAVGCASVAVLALRIEAVA
ncbi:hypothetical protein [Nocardioides albidus]|uniref:hypothetical protein n=1 Tax=Nocardioides albidus TaxID=1517589 RepID=UPI001863AD0E|nr:hypothetical protein [Nocardioides albidus]